MLGDAPLGRWPLAYLSNGIGDNIQGAPSFDLTVSGNLIGTSFLEASDTLTFNSTGELIGIASTEAPSTLIFTGTGDIQGLTTLSAEATLTFTLRYNIYSNPVSTISFFSRATLLGIYDPVTPYMLSNYSQDNSLYDSSSTTSVSLYDETSNSTNTIYEETT